MRGHILLNTEILTKFLKFEIIKNFDSYNAQFRIPPTFANFKKDVHKELRKKLEIPKKVFKYNINILNHKLFNYYYSMEQTKREYNFTNEFLLLANNLFVELVDKYKGIASLVCGSLHLQKDLDGLKNCVKIPGWEGLQRLDRMLHGNSYYFFKLIMEGYFV